MPEGYPTTPRPPRAVRAGAAAIGLAAIGLAAYTTLASATWVGRPFPGFLLLDNRVVASVGLAHWSGPAVPGLYRSEVEAVDGVPVASAAEVYDAVARRAPGTPLRYRLRRGAEVREVALASQPFTAVDWVLLFGGYLLNGAVYLASGVVVWVLRPRAPLARALLVWGAACAVFLLTAMEIYGPAHLFRLHAFAEALVPAASLQLALLFPQPHPAARWRFVGYPIALALAVPAQLVLARPQAYVAFLGLDVAFLAGVTALFAARLVSAHRRARSQLARQRVRVITLGMLFGFSIPGVIVVVSALRPGSVTMNLAALTPFLFALSLAYAVVKHDLFEIDAMVTRAAYYLLLTGAVGAAYVGAVVVFNLRLQAGAATQSPAFPVVFTLAVLLLFNPLRVRLQAFVDRVFLRTRYDGPQVLAAVGRELAATLTRDQIAALVRQCVDDTIPNGGTRLFVSAAAGGALREVGGEATVPPALVRPLAEGRVPSAFDPPESYADADHHETVRAALDALGAEIAVPLQLRDDLVGALTAGPKRSGLFYTAGDVQLLRALAHQAAIALENARTYEALIELNARLEERVRERTAQLEATNGELAEAYRELKTAEVQLVHAEKMASLGRLVAGVAHEINNPVSFIATSVAPLRRRLALAGSLVPAEVTPLLREAEEIVDVMARGAERTAGIVKDLRSFSRLGEAARKAVDLHDGLEVSLRLLEPRWRHRIEIHRDYGTLPLVECDPGQLNQVFMNVLANACDAIADRGNVWVTTRALDDHVVVTVRDDGPGIPPAVLGHIFDPFFTTKDVGGGTGLGLAISHGVVAAHGGRIEVESAVGAGATFRIVLPIASASLDRAASGAR
jgi:signal transduction histidine kinase